VKELIDMNCRLEKVPDKWKRGLIVRIPRKGEPKGVQELAGVTLLPVVSKILGKIVIDRIRRGIDCRLRKEQAGFSSGRGTMKKIFVLRQIF